MTGPELVEGSANERAGSHRYSRSRASTPRRASTAAASPASRLSTAPMINPTREPPSRARFRGRDLIEEAEVCWLKAPKVAFEEPAPVPVASRTAWSHLPAVVERPDLSMHLSVGVPRGRAATVASPARLLVTLAADCVQAFSKAAPEPRAIRVRLSFDLALKPWMRAVATALTSANEPVLDLVHRRAGRTHGDQPDEPGHQHNRGGGDDGGVEPAAETPRQPDLSEHEGGEGQQAGKGENGDRPDPHLADGSRGVGRDQVVQYG